MKRAGEWRSKAYIYKHKTVEFRAAPFQTDLDPIPIGPNSKPKNVILLNYIFYYITFIAFNGIIYIIYFI